MDEAGHEIFADSAFTGNQHLRMAGGDATGRLAQPDHRFAVADERRFLDCVFVWGHE